MAAVSIQLISRSRARWIAAMDSMSSCGPQANSQFPPPIAQAPNPMGVNRRSELPRVRKSLFTAGGVAVVAACVISVDLDVTLPPIGAAKAGAAEGNPCEFARGPAFYHCRHTAEASSVSASDG